MDKRYNHMQAEEAARELWEKEQTYAAKNNPGQPYTVDTPPPTASGSLHIGHVFSYTQTDIILRYKRMNGFSVVYPFGVDGNGLATERYVEKKHKVRGHDMPRSEFIELCLKESELMGQDFKQLWQQIGLSIDWNLFYSTISKRTRAIAQESFIRLHEKGFIYRKDEPALYCPTCHTTVAQAELDDSMVDTFFNDILFKDKDGNNLVISTTRPEMLPACVALFYHPNDERYKHLKDTVATVPLFGFTVPIMENDTVEIEKGSGLVMCCTFGDKSDIAWFKRFNLPYKGIMTPEGKFNEKTGFLAGLRVPAARKAVLEKLKEENLLQSQRAINHAVSVHERCKKEIEFIILHQWFVNLLEHKETFLQLAEQIEWSPKFMKSRYIDWVKNLGWDWCISRQRFYGVPFPDWQCADCGEIIFAKIDQLPIDPREVAYTGECPKCHGKNIKPDNDVMDTWNISSLTPYIIYDVVHGSDKVDLFDTKKVAEFLPMEMRPQAHDIIRTWAFYTIAKAWMHNKEIPWKNIVISGHVLSGTMKKISKSQGGAAVTPQDILKEFSADAIRYWTASGALGHDIAYSEEQIKIGQRLVTKLWNAFRFINKHSVTCDPANVPSDLGATNSWLLQMASECFASYHKYFEQYEFSLALDQIDKFFWKHFCDNYLEIIKDQLFNPANYSESTICATRWTLMTVGLRILQMYAPFVPYITETLYQTLYRKDMQTPSIHQLRYQDIQVSFVFPEQIIIANALLDIASTVRKLKTEKQLSLKTALESLVIKNDSIELLYALKKYEAVIKGVTQAAHVTFESNEEGESHINQENEQWHAVAVYKGIGPA